jgi:pimeloyl-ACP methyl ester carboxylesterase
MKHKMNTRFAISADSTRIAFDVNGAGTPILLLHGGGGNRLEWHDAGYVAQLQKEFTVIPVDLRGHGESDKPTDPAYYSTEKLGQDILAVADSCGLDRFILCGFSFGGNVSRYPAAQSDRVSRLVMLGNRLGSAVSDEFRQSIAEFQVRWADVVSHAASPFDPMSLSTKDQEGIQQLNFPGELLPSVMAWSTAMLDWSNVTPEDIRCPALWLIGSEDEGAMESYDQCAQGIPYSKVQLHILDGLNHEQVFDTMEQVLPFILSFIKQEK